jgi:uncharacterized membrane protein
MPWPRKVTRMDVEERIDDLKWESSICSVTSVYIRYIDIKRLTALAKAYHLKIRVLRRVGHFVPEGVPLLMVSRAERAEPARIEALRAAFDVGPSRTLQQDIEFGVLQIVDIALKAISPAVNDPTTAISCVDQLSRILIRVASREPAESRLYDPPGVLRVFIPWLGFERLLDSAFEQIRMYSKSDVSVSLRILRALSDIATTTKDPQIHDALLNRANRIVAGCAERLGEHEMTEIRARLFALQKT